jgi:hypothetical protein
VEQSATYLDKELPGPRGRKSTHSIRLCLIVSTFTFNLHNQHVNNDVTIYEDDLSVTLKFVKSLTDSTAKDKDCHRVGGLYLPAHVFLDLVASGELQEFNEMLGDIVGFDREAALAALELARVQRQREEDAAAERAAKERVTTTSSPPSPPPTSHVVSPKEKLILAAFEKYESECKGKDELNKEEDRDEVVSFSQKRGPREKIQSIIFPLPEMDQDPRRGHLPVHPRQSPPAGKSLLGRGGDGGGGGGGRRGREV